MTPNKEKENGIESLASEETKPVGQDKEYPITQMTFNTPTTYNPIGNRHRKLWENDPNPDYLG